MSIPGCRHFSLWLVLAVGFGAPGEPTGDFLDGATELRAQRSERGTELFAGLRQ